MSAEGTNDDPVVLRTAKPTPVRGPFTRGKNAPRGVVWFGLTSFWGHLRHFLASAIATEDVDSRDWMTPDPPQELADRIADILGGPHRGKDLLDNLERDLWVDYVADTGDDSDVSRAVAELLFARYDTSALEGPARIGLPSEPAILPRGEVLVFGGDTAYPVATAEEINNRVVVPFNEVLTRRRDAKPRVLLGIPGNHDWYDGLDGFARMFRRRVITRERSMPSVFTIPNRTIERYADWAMEFVRGGQLDKPHTLDLEGYVPVQSASYFSLPMTRDYQILAADRQLKKLDFRQRKFFDECRRDRPGVSPFVLLPDPVYAFGEPSASGQAMSEALGLEGYEGRAFVLSGDIHHYRRSQVDETLHVVAGGGGAFLHSAPFTAKQSVPAKVQWPTRVQCKPLLRQVPWKIAAGRSGILPHLAVGLMFSPAVGLGVLSNPLSAQFSVGPLGVGVVMAIAFAFLGGIRRGRFWLVALVAAMAGAVAAATPTAVSLAVVILFTLGGWDLAPHWFGAMLLALAVICGSWVFGLYLSVLTRLGLENTQAFTALDHPGFKHFLRMRFRKTGEVDVWCIGLEDPLHQSSTPVLVDRFQWRGNSVVNE